MVSGILDTGMKTDGTIYAGNTDANLGSNPAVRDWKSSSCAGDFAMLSGLLATLVTSAVGIKAAKVGAHGLALSPKRLPQLGLTEMRVIGIRLHPAPSFDLGA